MRLLKTLLPPFFVMRLLKTLLPPFLFLLHFIHFSLWWLIAVINLMWFWIVVVTNIWTCLNMNRDCLDLVKLRRPTLHGISSKLLSGILDWLKRRRGAEHSLLCFLTGYNEMKQLLLWSPPLPWPDVCILWECKPYSPYFDFIRYVS